MRFICLLACLIFSQVSIAQDSIYAPTREGRSNYVTPSELAAAKKFFGTATDTILGQTQADLAQLKEDSFEVLIQEWEALLDKEVKKNNRRRSSLDHLLNLLRGSDLIDDTMYRLSLDFIQKKYPTPAEIEAKKNLPGPAIALKDYLSKKAAIAKAFKKVSKNKNEVILKDQENPFPKKEYSFSAGKYSGLSAIERLYYLYSSSQIKEMANILDLTLNVSDAQSVVTTITFRDENRTPLVLAHSQTDQYRLALRIMKSEKRDAQNDSSRLGVAVTNFDMIASAYLLGVLSYDELSIIVHDKNFYLPDVSMLKKIGKYVGGLALLGARVHPVTAPYAIVALILYNSYADTRKTGKIDEDSFMFTLPEQTK